MPEKFEGPKKINLSKSALKKIESLKLKPEKMSDIGKAAFKAEAAKASEEKIQIPMDFDKMSFKLFGRELAVAEADENTKKELAKLYGMYESKDNQLDLKKEKIVEVKNEIKKAKEQISLAKYSERYLKNLRDERSKEELEQMQERRAKIESDLEMHKKQIADLEQNIKMDEIGMDNLSKKIEIYLKDNHLWQ